ncbi:hypothetical protein L5515_007302 [Caenorhabditis briggsae]|nr:hypothetical protein L5515_007302 [Caenorhabditis briggsae]
MSLLQPMRDMAAKMKTLCFKIMNFEHLDGSYTSESKLENGGHWAVRFVSSKTAKSTKRRLSVYLVCFPATDNPEWSVSTSFAFRFLNSWGNSKTKISPLCTHTFTAKDNSKGASGFCAWDDIVTPNSGFLVNGVFTIEFDLSISRTTGYQIEKKDHTSFLADGKLIVEDQTIDVCLALLADNSPVLYDMIYNENPGQTEFEIFDFTYDSILGMVSILQLDEFKVNVRNYRDLLELGQRYQIVAVMDQCEEFLLRTKKVSIETKLKLSETFQLHFLQFRTIERIQCMERLEAILDENIDIEDKTYEALLEKMKQLKSQEEKESCSCKKKHCGRSRV